MKKKAKSNVVAKVPGSLTTYKDGAAVFTPQHSTGEKLYTYIHSPLKGAVLQKSTNIYKVSVSTPVTTPNPAKVLRRYFEAAVAKLENIN